MIDPAELVALIDAAQEDPGAAPICADYLVEHGAPLWEVLWHYAPTNAKSADGLPHSVLVAWCHAMSSVWNDQGKTAARVEREVIDRELFTGALYTYRGYREAFAEHESFPLKAGPRKVILEALDNAHRIAIRDQKQRTLRIFSGWRIATCRRDDWSGIKEGIYKHDCTLENDSVLVARGLVPGVPCDLCNRRVPSGAILGDGISVHDTWWVDQLLRPLAWMGVDESDPQRDHWRLAKEKSQGGPVIAHWG